jgi:uncharacterized repeat protein (TIGR03803 family)
MSIVSAIIRKTSRYAFSVCAVGLLLAACGQQREVLPSQAAALSVFSRPPSQHGYRIVYKFQGNIYAQQDGLFPESNLIAVKDNLYGTTAQGGLLNDYSACGDIRFFSGCGTVFELNASGTESVLYRFAGGSDGFFPTAGLLNIDGTLYGTTSAGGTPPCTKVNGLLCGTVFSISAAGRERVLHVFASRPDGAEPSANLIAVNSIIYGVTERGGPFRGCVRQRGCGVVFRVSPSGRERVLYAFKGTKDGAFPAGSLLSLRGTLYGVTSAGGLGRCGTVFKISASGNESIVHDFDRSGDGCRPTGGLVAIGAALYGVTAYGGGAACNCGTIFKLQTNGSEKVIYRFRGGADGRVPAAGLVALKGAFYGTTAEGGNRGCSLPQGCGTIFKVSPSGAEQILHAFQGGADGVNPEAQLLAFHGTLYGTTQEGGDNYCGYSGFYSCGTVFSIMP